MKTCTKCLNTLPLTEFHRNAATLDGLTYHCKECNIKRVREWSEKYPEKRKQYNLDKYSLSLQDLDQMKKDQGYSCAICGIKEEDTSRKTLFIDHCHDSESVRGLLCHHCNSGLGYFRDNVLSLRKAIDYLTSSREPPKPKVIPGTIAYQEHE